mmetsp:Transcript_51879/g.112722  ORF Transcript_51879/g.112722 Transcript_51879/m.112722 type:complete len:289 (-) Transcript_51879:35-901(-)
MHHRDLLVANHLHAGMGENFVSRLPLLQSLNVASNRLSGALPYSTEVMMSLQNLELSSNPWGVSFAAFLAPLVARAAWCRLWNPECSALVTVLRVDNTTLSGTLPQELFALKSASIVTFKSSLFLRSPLPSLGETLTVPDLVFPALGVPDTLPHRTLATDEVDWLSFDLSGSVRLDGTLPPSWVGMPRAIFLSFLDTNLRGTHALPSFLKPSGETITRRRSLDSLPAICPALTTIYGNTTFAQVNLPPSYYDWQLCRCQPGETGRDGLCAPCPVGASCEDGLEQRSAT